MAPVARPGAGGRGVSERRVLAAFDAEGVYVYAAFKPATVRAAVRLGTFGAGFTLDRMTWIKPSFGWMLHRSDYATKHRQEAVARVRLSHAGFLDILARGVPTHHDPALFPTEDEWASALDASDVRYQWDPDRALDGYKLDRRAIQLGIRGETVRRYVSDWILGVEDATPLAREIAATVKRRGTDWPTVPDEREYPLPLEIRRSLGYDE
jgi:hypothetical protein